MRLIALTFVVVLGLPDGGLAQEACKAQRVTAPPAVETTDFGLAVATNGQCWFVASPDANTLCSGSPFACSTGAVFVYEEVGGRLVHRQTLVPPDVQLADKFGISIDVDGDRLVVGSLYTRWSGSDERTGAVFVYKHDGDRWTEIDRIQPPPEVTREFAVALELHGDTLLVTPLDTNRVFVFTEDDRDGWLMSQRIEYPVASAPPSGFGGTWSIRDPWFVTGAYLDRQVIPNGGAVFIYRRNAEGLLELQQELSADGEWMYLGISLDFVGNQLVVGAPLASRGAPYQGVVQLYTFDGERWVIETELTQDEPRENRQFGNRVLAQNGRLFVSAFNERTSGSRGMVHSFMRSASGQWIQADRLEPNPVEYAGHYGTALAASGRRLMVGAQRDEAIGGGVVGAAYFFDLTCTDCPPDLDLDGSLTVFDFLTFLNLFQDADPIADFDGDGELTIFDFLAFQTAFDAGCE